MRKRRSPDWHPEDIKAAVRKTGWTLVALSRAYGLPECSAKYALRHPHFDGEMAIAECLSLSPRQIWPSRFDPNGIRRHRRRRMGKVIANAIQSHCQSQKAA